MPAVSVSAEYDWDDITVSTLRDRSGKISDNWTSQTILMDKIKSSGTVKPFGGGRSIVKEIVYKGNDTVKRYSGFENLDVRPNQIFTAAEFYLKQYAVAVVMSGLETLQNTGPNAIVDILESRIDNAEQSLYETMAEDMYGDGTAAGGKAIGGLELLVSDTGLGSVGGISADTWSFWRNQVLSFSGDSLGAASSTSIQTAMNRLWLKLQRGKDKPNLLIFGENYYRYYLESLQAIQRIAKEDQTSAGFTVLKYMGADVVADAGFGSDMDPNKGYFLNTKYIEWNPHKDRNFVPLNPTRHSTNQDGMIKLLAFAGNTSIRNRQLQGVLTP